MNMVPIAKAALYIGATVAAGLMPFVVGKALDRPIDNTAIKQQAEELHNDIQAQRRKLEILSREVDQLNRLTAQGSDARAVVDKAVSEVVQERNVAREDAERFKAMAADALSCEAPLGTSPASAPTTGYVYFGNCGRDGWLSVNFANPPPCRGGDIVVLPKYVQGRSVRALRNLTLRSALPSNDGKLGSPQASFLPSGHEARIVDVYPMSTISGPPILYWAKVTIAATPATPH